MGHDRMSRTLRELEERKRRREKERQREREIESKRERTGEGIDDGEEVFPT